MTAFEVRAVTVAPGESREIDTREFAGALLMVHGGEIELACRAGASRRFRDGDLLWIEGLGARWIRNPGARPTRLVAISRRTDESAPAAPSNGSPQREETQR